ncbi:hypothetical protein CY35_10G065200 [Sphagnum magellanicum]|nr:hypothetical protein CY35_10G065200 [Sphagnum magellanicum]
MEQMPRFASTIFTRELTSFHNQKSGECKEEFEDFLQAASEGHGSSGGEIWKMRTKWGHDLKVLLLASMCTDSGGVMSGGTMCVIMPFMMPGLHLDCNIPPLDDVQDIDTEEEQLSSGNESPRDSDDEDLVPPEQPQSPSSEGGVDGLDMFCDPGTTALHGSSVCSQDWCKSEKGAQVSPGSKSGEQTLSGSVRSKVMVVDPQASGRKSLTLMLERCGIEVTEACSSKEALWQFEQTLHKPDAGFSVLFMDLAVASADDYAAVCEIRQAEHKDFGSSRFTPQVLIVAVTNHDSRWELANMEEYIQMGLEMGIDAIISRPSRVQQLRNILSDLGVCSEFLNKSPQAKSRCWQSPLILVRYQ